MAKLCFISATLLCIFLHSVVSDERTINQEARGFGSPLTHVSLERVKGNVFGTARGARSSDIILFNKSAKDFTLFNAVCSRGGWTTELYPEPYLPAYATTVFGTESNGFLGSATCTAVYRNKDGSTIEMETNNPYLGNNGANHSISSNLKVSTTVGNGNNNQVRFLMEVK